MKYPLVHLKKRFLIVACVLAVGSLCALPANAQVDRVYTNNAATPTAGQITAVTKNGVQLKTGATTQNFASSDIKKILFQGDPSALVKGREAAIGGQYEQAVEELKGLAPAALGRDVVKADAGYYLVLSRAKLALSGRGNKTEAAKAALAFAGAHKDSYHFYSVARILGDLAMALNNHEQALRYYGSLENAPATEMKIESRYLTGVALLGKGDTAAAEKKFDDVIGLKANTPEILRLNKLAQAGKAVALARAGKGNEGLALVNKLIEDLSPTDIEMAARVYNAQGACYEAMGDKEGAVFAYLHTHLMFSTQADAHATALAKLIELWPLVGHPERAAEARQEMQQRYPGFGK